MKALIVIDLQKEFLGIITPKLVECCKEVTNIANVNNIPIVWIYSVYGEVNPTAEEQEHKISATHIGKIKMCVRGTEGANLVHEIEELSLQYGTKIEKQWYSAFKQTDLQEFLAFKDVTELYLCGVTLNSCVYATSLDACQLNYKVNIISDCCNSFGEERKVAGLETISKHPNTTIITSEEFVNSMLI
jgi:nicotinamidase-related amidase